jgi:hypothetical protein
MPVSSPRQHDCLLRVRDQVQHHLLELRRVRQCLRQPRIQSLLDFDVLELQFVGANGKRPLEHVVQMHGAPLGFGLSREKQQFPYIAPGTLGFLRDALRVSRAVRGGPPGR